MDADQPPSESAPELPRAEFGDAVAPGVEAAPAVVAVVVVEGDAPHLEACLTGLLTVEYPDLTVLVIAESDEDLRARVAAKAPTAFVRAVTVRGFAAGANEAISTVQGAPFLLFLRPDVVCEPGTVRLLIEEAFRSNAAVVGPKVVAADHPERLREVGWSIDRFGVPHSEIERDELDQEQHDAVRDVFFVGDACMLVRADLFAALEGFDPDCDPGAHEVDLCWRARLLGARVLVAPDARVGRHDDEPPSTEVTRLSHRHRLRALLTNTSTARLAWIAPVALVMHALEALVFLVRRQRLRASILMGGWAWNLRHLSDLRSARKRSQAGRVVPEREIHALQYLGSARVAHYVANSLHTEDRVRSLSDRGRSFAGSARGQFRSLRGILLLALLLAVVFGSREILFGRLIMVGEFTAWPGVGALVRAFTSHWRYADLGSAASAPPILALAAGMRTVLFGADGLGQTVIVVGAMPVGILGARYLAQRVIRPGWPDLVAAAVYALLPLPRNAIAEGRLGALVMYATAPYVFLALAQLAGLVPSRWPRRRIMIVTAVLVGVTAAFWPLAVAFPAVVMLAVLMAAPVSGDARVVLEPLGRGVAAVTGLALALLVPWPPSFLAGGDRAGALGIVENAPRALAPLVRFATGVNGGGVGGWALLVGGLAVVLLVSGERERWVVRLWALALLSFALAALPNWIGSASPAPEGVLVPAGLALAIIVAIGAATFAEEIRRAALGWRHVAAVVVAGLLGLAGLGFLGDAVSGSWHQPASDWNEAFGWMSAQRDQGGFRVLWLGSPETVPGSRHRSGPDAFSVSIDGPPGLLDAMAPPGGDGSDALRAAVAAIRPVQVHRLGRRLQPMGVRYIVLLHRSAPSSGAGSDAAPGLARGLRQQLDLRELEGTPGATVYESVAWSAARAAGAGRGTVTDPWPAGGGRVARVWSQQYDAAWEASRDGSAFDHRRVAGWANGFVPTGSGPVEVRDTHQWFRWVALAIQVLIIAGCARLAFRRDRRRRLARRAAHAGRTADGEAS